MAINFISSKEDSDETRTMRAKDDNIEIMMGSETDEIIEVLFKSLFQRYQEGFGVEVDLFLIVLMHCIIILIK